MLETTADAILVSIISLTSLVVLIIQKYKINQLNFDIEHNAQFSTARKDYIKFVLTLCQVILFSLLVFLRIQKMNESNVLHAGLLVLSWIYCMVLCLLICFIRVRNWKWILNAHVTSIYGTASLCATWQLWISIKESEFKIIAIINLVISTILTVVSITTPKGPPVCNKGGRPITSIVYSSIWDFITFSTIIPLIHKAREKNTLNDPDLDELPNEYLANELYNEIQKWRSSNLLYRLWKANQNVILIEIFFVIISSFLHYLPILFLYSLLDLFQSDQKDIKWAIFCVFGILIGGLLHAFTISQHQYWGCSVLQSNVGSMLNSVIYSKSLKIKNDVNEIGKISNLMAVDAYRITQFSIWLASLIEGPIQIGIGLFFLYKLIKGACLIGILVLVIILPIQRWVGKYFFNNQEHLMKTRDYRVDLMNELLQGVRMIKFNAWEKNWIKRILDARNDELKYLKTSFILMSAFNLLWIASPILITTVSFLSYSKIQGKELTAAIAFTSVAIFNELRFILNDLAELFILGLQAMVSLYRIEKFLNSDENEIEKNITFEGSDKIVLQNATITWNKSEDIEDVFVMKDLNIEFPVERLSIICGPTGSGKTLLLMALLGEAKIQSGKVFYPIKQQHHEESDWIIDNSIAYVAQHTWLQHDSIRNNILFNLPFDNERYDQVVKSCELDKDFKYLVDGDLTEIGEQGVTLSGGQKQRIALARAIYSRAKHILIDDALSAVDANTAKHLINECICGPLMDKRTRILVTHHLNLTLSVADYMVSIDNGQIVDKGEISEICNATISIRKELTFENNVGESGNSPSQEAFSTKNKKNFEEILTRETPKTLSSDITVIEISECNNNDNDIPRMLVQEEGKASGMMQLNVYLKYFKSNGGYLFWIVALLLFISTRTAQILEGWWLSIWSDSTKPTQHNVIYYITIYIIITMLSVFFSVMQFSCLYFGSLRASKQLYHQLLNRVIQAPLRFFDTTPVGRILNRFGKDFEVIDSILSVDLGLFLHNLLMMIGVVIIITAITKEFAIAAVIFVIVYVIVGILYAKVSRELKRLDSVTKSPLYSHYTETLTGIATIRAFNVSEQFMNEMYTRVDNNIRPFYFLWVANRWLQIWTNGIGAFFPFIAGLLILWKLHEINPSLAGLSLSYSMTFTSQIMWSIRKYTQLEISLNSIERVVEFLSIQQENYHGEIKIKEERENSEKREKRWPVNGSIKFENLKVKYAEDLENVLHDISFEINGKEKVGIIGRTGSGKSTMSLSLFRFLEASEGKIFIDGIDISKLDLEELRSNLTIIPQDPILFTGTIRSNLDLLSQYSDYELFESLKRVHLLPSEKSSNDHALTAEKGSNSANVFSSLDTPISEGGNNLSQGQRQLLCLARALLKKPKIIIMDEATASIDFGMDEKIQQMIRREFNDCTVICIAHRLRTIIDYDKILVLGVGRVLEFGSPYDLMSNTNSKFYQMCANDGDFENLKLLALKQ